MPVFVSTARFHVNVKIMVNHNLSKVVYKNEGRAKAVAPYGRVLNQLDVHSRLGSFADTDSIDIQMFCLLGADM